MATVAPPSGMRTLPGKAQSSSHFVPVLNNYRLKGSGRTSDDDDGYHGDAVSAAASTDTEPSIGVFSRGSSHANLFGTQRRSSDDSANTEPIMPHATPLRWYFAQSFGTDAGPEGPVAEDVFTALEFSPDGQFLALGDFGGRVTLLKKKGAYSEDSGSPERQQAEDNQFLTPPGAKSPVAQSGTASPSSPLRTQAGDSRSSSPQTGPLQFGYASEFQAHNKQFDPLSSKQMSESVNVIKWLPRYGAQSAGSMMITCNDGELKLWKISEVAARPPAPNSTLSKPGVKVSKGRSVTKTLQQLKKVSKTRSADWDDEDGNLAADVVQQYVHIPKPCRQKTMEYRTRLKRYYRQPARPACKAKLHTVSLCSDGVVQLPAPVAGAAAQPVISCAAYHPKTCTTFAYSTTDAKIKLCDMRLSIVDPKPVTELGFASHTGSDYFGAILSSISSFCFTPCGNFIVARDLMSTKVWDVRFGQRPIQEFQVHPNLYQHLNTMASSGNLFDKFQVRGSPDGRHFLTGSYTNNFVIQTPTLEQSITIHGESYDLDLDDESDSSDSALGENPSVLNFKQQCLNGCWYPLADTPAVAMASLNRVFLYQALPSMSIDSTDSGRSTPVSRSLF